MPPGNPVEKGTQKSREVFWLLDRADAWVNLGLGKEGVERWAPDPAELGRGDMSHEMTECRKEKARQELSTDVV